MKNWIILAMLTAMSTVVAAGHHEDAGAKYKGDYKMSGLFKQADLNKDGTISEAEHEAAMTKMADKRRVRFTAMDANGDGAVSQEEAKAVRKIRHEKAKSAVE